MPSAKNRSATRRSPATGWGGERKVGGGLGVSTGGGLAAMTNGLVCPWFVWTATLGGPAAKAVGRFVRGLMAATAAAEGGRLETERAGRLVCAAMKLLLTTGGGV